MCLIVQPIYVPASCIFDMSFIQSQHLQMIHMINYYVWHAFDIDVRWVVEQFVILCPFRYFKNTHNMFNPCTHPKQMPPTVRYVAKGTLTNASAVEDSAQHATATEQATNSSSQQGQVDDGNGTVVVYFVCLFATSRAQTQSVYRLSHAYEFFVHRVLRLFYVPYTLRTICTLIQTKKHRTEHLQPSHATHHRPQNRPHRPQNPIIRQPECHCLTYHITLFDGRCQWRNTAHCRYDRGNASVDCLWTRRVAYNSSIACNDRHLRRGWR